jgi:histidyl-tRNA synthetase
VIGSNALINEYELIRIMDDVFQALELKVVIRMNNRKLLSGLVELMGATGRMTDIAVAIDKLEKAGMEEVLSELGQKGIGKAALELLVPVIEMKGSGTEKMALLEKTLHHSTIGMEGIQEVKKLFAYTGSTPLASRLEFDITLARGLNYYTGTIFEVKSEEVEIGSICGGGRYDDLTGIFGLEGVSGVGVSFGADRIYDVLEQLDRFPGRGEMDTRVLFVNFGEREAQYIFSVLDRLRRNGIASELYPDAAKMKKQLGYANARNIPFVALVGEQEISDGVVTLKEMETGAQERLTPEQLVARLLDL